MRLKANHSIKTESKESVMTKAEAKQLHKNSLNVENKGKIWGFNVFLCNLGLMISLLFSRSS